MNLLVVSKDVQSSISQKESILTAIKKNPDLTVPELAQICGLSEKQISRRVSELKQSQKIRSNGTRLCSVKSVNVHTWKAVRR